MTATKPCSSVRSAYFGRSLLLASAVSLILAGCGGGGGDNPAPVAQPSSGSDSGAPSNPSDSGGANPVPTPPAPSGGSANATPIVYVADQTTQEVDEIYLVDASAPGGSVKLNAPLVYGGNVYDFALSPDGKYVIYVADQDIDTRYELYRVNLDKPGAVVKLNPPLSANRDVMDFVLSPDGSKVVYRSDSAVEDIFELYLVDLANPGTAIKLSGALTPGGSVRNGYAFSPDGSQVAYRADQQVFDRLELFAAAIATPGVSVKLNSTLVQDGDVTSGFRFSPDGARVAYVADQDSNEVLELYATTLANPGITSKLNGALVTGGDVCQFDFSPDSKRVAYCADQTTDGVIELFTTALAAPGASTKLNPALVTGGNVKAQYEFTPDSAAVLYLADQQVDEKVELYRVNIAAPGAATKINAGLIADGDVWEFKFRPDGTHVSYVATQENLAVYELYQVALAAPGAAAKLSAQMQGAGLWQFEYSTDSARVYYTAEQDLALPELYRVEVANPTVSTKLNGQLTPAGGVWGFISHPGALLAP